MLRLKLQLTGLGLFRVVEDLEVRRFAGFRVEDLGYADVSKGP